MTISYSEYMIDEKWDVNIPVVPSLPVGLPEIRYAIVGSPRVGSNLLCDYLQLLGLGVPMEYFSNWTIEELAKRWDSNIPATYCEDLMIHRTTLVDDKLIFGVKTLWPNEWQRAQTFSWPNHVIRLFREDREEQVMSYALAKKSAVYASMTEDDGPPPEIEAPTPEELTYSESVIMQLEQFWNQTAAEASAAFSYEFLVDKPVKALRHIVDEVFEVDVPVPEDITPRLKKQAT